MPPALRTCSFLDTSTKISSSHQSQLENFASLPLLSERLTVGWLPLLGLVVFKGLSLVGRYCKGACYMPSRARYHQGKSWKYLLSIHLSFHIIFLPYGKAPDNGTIFEDADIRVLYITAHPVRKFQQPLSSFAHLFMRTARWDCNVTEVSEWFVE